MLICGLNFNNMFSYFISEQAFQTCPCPMQSSCPKNVHTGPLTGASKRSEAENQNEVAPLLPVALALPPEPTGASPGPPSPARGSAGMPPPASPALSTARNNSWSPPAQGLLKPVTPPPTLTVVEPPPPPAAPVVVPPAAIKRKASKRASTEALEVPKKKKKVISITTPNNKKLLQNSKKGTKTKETLSTPESVKVEIKVNPKKNSELALRRNPSLKWSNGWSWEGDSFKAKVFLTTEDPGVVRKCFPAMRHREGDVIRPKDCILLRSGPRKNLPFVAKVSAMWENPDDGEMMVSVLWYYRPEHTEQGRLPDQPPDEIFASKHKDTNSVACIEDKCYVLTYHEYCRYRKSLVNGGRKCQSVVPPMPEGYPRADKLPPYQVSNDLIFFCRQIYDFRQKKILKKPPSQPHPRS